MRSTYEHHFTGDLCEAAGCRIKTRSLWGTRDGRLIRACCPGHAEEVTTYRTPLRRKAPAPPGVYTSPLRKAA